MRIVKLLLFAFLLWTGANANAALQSRLGGLAVYDTDLNITWLAEATPSCGTFCFDWNTANNYVTSLSVAGITGWRLPATMPADPSCTLSYSQGSQCTGSEMGHLFYFELGGLPGNGNWNLFTNLKETDPGSATAHRTGYWSGTSAGDNQYWDFAFTSGGQGIATTGYAMGAWAVHDGDVAPPVPEPTSWAMLLAGLAALGWVARRR